MALSRGVASVEVDGKSQRDGQIPLTNDQAMHHVRVVLGEVPTKEEPAAREVEQAHSD